MALSSDDWPAAAIADRTAAAGEKGAPNLAVLIVDARNANPRVVLANGVARDTLTPAVRGAPSFVGCPLREWLAAPQAALIAQALAGLSRLQPRAQRTIVWPFVRGEIPTPTRFRLLDWDPSQVLVMLSFSAASRPPKSSTSPTPRDVSPEVVPRGVAGMAASAAPIGGLPPRMRRSEDLLRATMANTADTLAFLDTSLRVRFMNKAHDGLSTEQILGGDFGALLPPVARESIEARLRHLLATGEPLECQHEWPDELGRVRHREIRAALVRDAGVGMGVCVSIRDITELKRLEREILEASALERQRIGRDLHDGLGQDLTGVALMVRALATRLERDCPSLVESASEIVRHVNQSLENARSLAHGLLPVSREGGGLAGALRSLAHRTRVTCGLDVRLRVDTWPELRLPEAHASDLYRIAQEALTNAARHAEATWVKITLHVGRDRYCLKIADNGIGVPRPRERMSGMGLRIMAHRAEILGAKLAIVRNPPRGTLIRVTGPQAPLPSAV